MHSFPDRDVGTNSNARIGGDAERASDRSARVGALFEAALAQPHAERARFLAGACHGDQALGREVESLLAAHDDAGEFLATAAPVVEPATGVALAPRFSSGTRFGPYELVAPLGAGGMGEVYRARDTRLDRDVALKVLSAQLSHRPRDRDRFEREARTISKLTHPHICRLFDVGRATDGEHDVPFLVMELLQGETLAARLTHGPLPVPDAVGIAIQMAEALAAAHAAGIVHRDLKPANIMLTRAGTGRSGRWHVTLLDFGLSRLRSPGDEHRPGALSTQGVLVGTLPYMAPEQVRGEAVDARADLFAFGAVLYEMLTGRRAFAGNSSAELAVAILEREPPSPSTVQRTVPDTLDRIARTCLAKDPAERWQHAYDLVLQLQAVQALDLGRPARRKAGRTSSMIAILGLAAVAALMLPGVRPAHVVPAAPAQHFDLMIPRLAALESLALSPDGRRLAFIAAASDGRPAVWVRSMDDPLPRVVSGTEGAYQESPPFWSPDGEWLAFAARGSLRRVRVAGSESQAIADITGGYRGGAWGPDGTILVGLRTAQPYGVHRGHISGGPLVPFVPLQAHAFLHARPTFLPDGRRFLYFTWTSDKQHRDICIASLDAPRGACLAIRPDLFVGLTEDGRLLYTRDASLFSHRFDFTRGVEPRAVDSPRLVAEHLAHDGFGRAAVSVAPEGGTLVYQPAIADLRELVWLDRRGTRLATVGDPAVQGRFDTSADGTIIAAERSSGRGTTVWTLDGVRGAATAVPVSTPDAASPTLSPDGLTLSYVARPAGHAAIVERPARGGPERVLFEHRAEGVLYFADRSADGTQLVVGRADGNGRFLEVVPAAGGAPVRIVGGSGIGLGNARISADARWLAYESRQTGRSEIYLSPIPATGEQRQVSVSGGQHPYWGADGRELFFVAPDGWLMSAPVTRTETMDFEVAERLFKTDLVGLDLGSRRFAVTADGERFLVSWPTDPVRPTDTTTLRVVLNWTGMLRP